MSTLDIEKFIPVITKTELIAKTEALVHNEGMQYIEALIRICNDLGVDPEDISKLITGPLKDKLEAEAMRNHLIPRSSNSIMFA